MTSPGRSAAQAIDALRRGWPVRIAGATSAIDVLAVETASDASLTQFARGGGCDLMISFERAITLKLVSQLAAAQPGPVVIALGEAPDLSKAIAVADPARDLATPFKGPFDTLVVRVPDAATAAVALARHAGLLPALFVRASRDDDELVHTDHDAVAAFADPAALVIAARARLPVSASVDSEIVAFRSIDDPHEHVALIVGTPDTSPPLVRLHSECLTGDVLGSLKCDCGPQLHGALDRIADAGWGVLLYLRQEGRGIGLINKLRAYELQDQGFDTVDANIRLGFPVEARDFAIAARMLDLLEIPSVRLLTNNPDKVARLEAAGIAVVERLPLALAGNAHNERYLATKRDRTGHQL
ncbi:GTP cyclohydrolase II [Sphingorhabdus soli]|uniref:GTP cyclohydrolase-2 n=1 Tax=Flavisphingopyxis soli TaxID=2601267 RepID=A0A5C6URU3_9SPHN|nr:GTP cyclohydrolase II [Sphingorhabdus soli]TXC73568.1 GTP cyclohydrolase II [Sphingorhabdus soli]